MMATLAFNELRRKRSSKIMIFQIHLGFFISLTKNGHFINMDPIEHIRSSFFGKAVHGLMLFSQNILS